MASRTVLDFGSGNPPAYNANLPLASQALAYYHETTGWLLMAPEPNLSDLTDGIGQPNCTQPEYPDAIGPWCTEESHLGFDLPAPRAWVLMAAG
jgi:hypothetical protein